MYDALATIHTYLGYVVFLAVLAAAVLGLARARADAAFTAVPFSAAMTLVDVQVTIGIVAWIVGSGWQFGATFAWIHPLIMLAGVAAGHVGLGRARGAVGPGPAYRVAGIGLAVATVLILIGIGLASAA